MLRLSSGGALRRDGGSADRGLYYGWVVVGTLAITETVSYGILSYAFPVFLGPMHEELGWSAPLITGAFSLAALVAGLAAPLVGRWLDTRGPRALMTGASALAATLLLGWSRVESVAVFYLLWAVMGLAMAGVLYEPAFAVVARWFVRRRGRALTVLTFVAGFASVIFVPLASLLVEARGWREALLWLAGILALTTVLPHALLLRSGPGELGLQPDGAGEPPRATAPRAGVPAAAALRSPSFAWLAAAFGLSALATTAMAVHLVPLLIERGLAPLRAAGAMGVLGLMALPGRVVFTPLGDRFPRAGVAAGLFVLQGLGLGALLLVDGVPGVWLCIVLFGMGFGAITPARAALVADLYGTAEYGRISGVLALVLAFARAAAPLGGSLLHGWSGGYRAVLLSLAGGSLLSAAAVLTAARPRPDPAPSPRRPRHRRPSIRRGPRGVRPARSTPARW